MSKKQDTKGSNNSNYVMRIVKMILILLVIIAFGYIAIINYNNKSRLVYADHLSDVAVTVDGEDITLEDLMFYVLYEEQLVEEQARIYNPESPKDYWNTHTNGYFLQGQAKEAVIGMAIHDRIFYRQAKESGMLMTTADKELLENARTDFWTSLYDEQIEKMPSDFESVNAVIGQMALAQLYQKKLSEELSITYSGLNWNGYDYNQILTKEHKVKYNKKIWDRVIIGDITLTHNKVNYVNGWDSEDEEQKGK